MWTVNLKFVEKIFYILLFLLPIQDFTNYICHIPRSFQLLHIFVVLGLGYCFLLYKKYGYLKTNKTVIFLYLIYTVLSIISTIINLPRLQDVDVLLFPNICFNYSKFWDNPSISPWFRGVFKPCEMLAFILIMFSLTKIKNFKEKTLKIIIYLALCTSLYGFYQIFAFKYNLPFATLFSGVVQRQVLGEIVAERATGMFFEGGSQAVFLAIPWCVLLSQLFEKSKFIILKNKIITTLTFIISTIALIFTYSPIAYITFLLGGFIYFLLSLRYIPWKNLIFNKIFIVFLFIFLIVAIYIFFNMFNDYSSVTKVYNYIIYKVQTSLFEQSSPIVYLNEDSRSIRAFGGIQAFLNAPWFGIGPGNGGYFYWSYVPFVSGTLMVLFCPFINDYICVLAEQGIFSFIIFVLFILYPLFLYIKKRHNIGFYKNLIDGMLAGYVVTIFASLQSFNYTKLPAFWMFYIILVVFIMEKRKYFIKEKK